ncbi:MFS transporter [Penicillium malachiteum]|nr:MFS transporter [Penicillium malachiteum]
MADEAISQSKDMLHAEHVESIAYPGFSDEEATILRAYEGARGKQVIRKIDFHLLPVLAFLYLCSHVDRNNLGNAKIEGMNTDLGLVGNQYNIASTLFFVPYIIFEIPSNVMLKKTRPSLWLSAQVVTWGIVMTSHIFLYRLDSFPVRSISLPNGTLRTSSNSDSRFYTLLQQSPGHSVGLLAYAISNMGGLRGIAGWRWIFILEGIVPTLFGFLLPFLLPDSPEKVSWLTSEEIVFLNLRFRQTGDRSVEGEGDKFSWSLLLETMLDWKILLAVLMAMVNAAPNAAFSYTMPTIINKMGFEAQKAQLLTIPPYFCGAVSSWLSGLLADRSTWRFPFIVVPMVVMLVSFVLLLVLSSSIDAYKGVMYFAIILAQIGIYPLLPGISAWTGNNLPQSWKRSIRIAWLLAAGNTASFIGTNVFLENQAPRYVVGYGVCLGVISLGIVACCILEFSLWRLNRIKKRMAEDQVRETHSVAQLTAMGERSPSYIYKL